MSFKDPTGFPTRSQKFSRSGFHSSYSRNHYPCRSKFSEDDFVELEQVHCVAPQAARISQKKTRSSRRSSNDLFSGSIFPADQKHFFQSGKRRANQHSADIFYPRAELWSPPPEFFVRRDPWEFDFYFRQWIYSSHILNATDPLEFDMYFMEWQYFLDFKNARNPWEFDIFFKELKCFLGVKDDLHRRQYFFLDRQPERAQWLEDIIQDFQREQEAAIRRIIRRPGEAKHLPLLLQYPFEEFVKVYTSQGRNYPTEARGSF